MMNPQKDHSMDVHVYIHGEPDVPAATRLVRQFAERQGFDPINVCYLATVASELASNLWIHAGGGVLSVVVDPALPGIQISTSDTGPGIENIELAMQDGYSTAGGLGCGLPGVKRLMDEVEIDSRLGEGTIVRAWKKKPYGQ